MIKSRYFIIYATADWDQHYLTNKQHTARHLAKLGHSVLYVESVGIREPDMNSKRDLYRMIQRIKKWMKDTNQVEKNIWVLSPVQIPFWRRFMAIRYMNQIMLRWSITKFVRKYFFKRPIVWTYHPFMLDSLDIKIRGPIVYHCVDDLAAIPGIDSKAFKDAEKNLLEKADIVFTTSQALKQKCAEKNPCVYNFPNVVDFEHFAKAHQMDSLPFDLKSVPKPRIGYIGVLSDFKVDFSLVFSIASKRPNWHWIFIGDEREGQKNKIVQKMMQLTNIHFFGYRCYDELPNYLSGFDVAVLPTLLNEYTRSMFPMKYFEYLAAGVPVVSTALDFTRSFTDGMVVCGDVDSFIKGIEKTLRQGKISFLKSKEYVGENTWTGRMNKMLQLIEAIE